MSTNIIEQIEYLMILQFMQQNVDRVHRQVQRRTIHADWALYPEHLFTLT